MDHGARARLFSCAMILALGASCAGCHMGLLGVVAGSSTSGGIYRADTIARELGPASVRTLGCLDVGLAVDEALLELHIGNRCGHPEALDFAKVRIEGLDPEGDLSVVTLRDPRNEIVMLHVGAGERGKERIRLNASGGLVRLSFDLDEIAPDARSAHPARIAFARESPSAPWIAVPL